MTEPRLQSRLRRWAAFAQRPFDGLLPRRLLTFSVVMAFALAAVAVAGVLTGVWVERRGGSERAAAMLASLRPAPNDAAVEWRRVSTHYHQLDVAAIPLPRSTIAGGSLTLIGDNLLIASTHGRFTYLDANNRLHPLSMNVRMNIEGLRNHPLYRDPRFNLSSLRTHDLLAVPAGDNRYDLYASHDRFAGDCVEFVVSRIRMESVGDVLRPVGRWVDVWTATPCLRFKDRGTLLEGGQQGGRMVRYSEDTILIAIGDYQRDGFYDSATVSMDPAVDFGKLIEFNLNTGAARHFAIGLRNPQGLTIDRQGRIWDTEHGPQGGDEINLLVEGGNYGWPIVTYGMMYGTPPSPWPPNPAVGRHDGYARPRYAFVPSVGISNLIAPDPAQFPNWADSLLVGSLRGETLFVVKLDGDDVVLVEPIELQHRLRDIASLHDGRLAILADHGALLLVRNADRASGQEQRFTVAGLAALPSPSMEEAPDRRLTGPERGRALFAAACANCHSVEGAIGIGPPLNGVVGRRIGSVEGFAYSRALAERGGVWSAPQLADFMHYPESIVPGTTMAPSGLHDGESWYVAQYLETLRGGGRGGNGSGP